MLLALLQMKMFFISTKMLFLSTKLSCHFSLSENYSN